MQVDPRQDDKVARSNVDEGSDERVPRQWVGRTTVLGVRMRHTTASVQFLFSPPIVLLEIHWVNELSARRVWC